MRFGKQIPHSKTILKKQLVLSFSVPHPQTGQGGTGIIQDLGKWDLESQAPRFANLLHHTLAG